MRRFRSCFSGPGMGILIKNGIKSIISNLLIYIFYKSEYTISSPPLPLEKIWKIAHRFLAYIALSVAAHLEKAGFRVKIYDAYLEGASISDIGGIITCLKSGQGCH